MKVMEIEKINNGVFIAFNLESFCNFRQYIVSNVENFGLIEKLNLQYLPTQGRLDSILYSTVYL